MYQQILTRWCLDSCSIRTVGNGDDENREEAPSRDLETPSEREDNAPENSYAISQPVESDRLETGSQSAASQDSALR